MKFNSIEEYYAYNRENAKKWYSKPENREHKRQYMKEYNKRKRLEKQQEKQDNQ